MNYPEEIARHLRQVHTGGNWTTSNLKTVLEGISWQQATARIGSCNTIAALVFHIHYYVAEVTKVLQGQPLTAKDEYSYDVPEITSAGQWEVLVQKALHDAEVFAGLIEQLAESRLQEDFTDAKYGTYYRNLQGIIEHTHYHLGQIAVLKKLV
ncbi:MAG: DinB family protein [Bacteroidia bacterium]|jgi:uncharacterized damage-inducible protein DinB|nr:DinB family protein [Bacteroidia bacterium]